MHPRVARATIGGVMCTVLIVDDHESFRTTARALLEADGFEVVGEVGDGESAIAEAKRVRHELVLLDIQLPDSDGFKVAERIGETGDPPAIVGPAFEILVDWGSAVVAI